MRLLLDECIHPHVAGLLVDVGHDVVTVASLEMCGATDAEVLAAAVDQQRVLVTLDTDFGEILVRAATAAPTVILIRRRDHRPEGIAAVIVDVLASSSESLVSGALAVVGERTVRIRELPLTT